MRVLVGLVVASCAVGVAADGITCAELKGVYRDNSCCDETATKDVSTTFAIGKEADPPVPGVLQGRTKAHVLLGMAPDYPPYTSWSGEPLKLSGFNKEFADLMYPICGVKVDMILAPWSGCWTAKPASLYFSQITEYIGSDIWEGRVHGCTAYTHTKGERELSLEFTSSILSGLKSAGILTKLVNGKPKVSPTLVNYTGVKLGDVTGWAPTADTFKYNQNWCAGGKQFFTEDAILTPGADGNGPAIAKLLDGTFDALYIYADQIDAFINSNDPLAAGFGSTFAYIHTGLDQWSINGTTLAISKKGSGLKDVLDPCIETVAQTQNYTTLCKKYFKESACIKNAYGGGGATYWYDEKMSARTDSNMCANGYCQCSGQ
jgi:hypothetical protein